MKTTHIRGATPQIVDAPAAVRLRVDRYDVLAHSKGMTTVEAQAEWHGVHRSTMFRLRGGENVPSLELAMRIATDLGTTVEYLFERVAAG